jgi:hypothetical protein
MAHGLRGIVNSGYMPYGSGRDFFFIGDFSYKNGRRTPDANLRWREAQKGYKEPKKRPRGEPIEMKQTKAINGQWGASSSSSSKKGASAKMSPRICERLRRQQSEPTVNDALQAGSLGFAHTSRWKDAHSSARVPQALSLRPGGPKDTVMPPYGTGSSTYSDIGQVHLLGQSYSLPEFGVPEKFLFHSAKLAKNGKPQPNTDEHMQEFPGKQKQPSAIQKKLYQNALQEVETPLEKPLSKTTPALLEWGHPAKHNHHSGKTFPPSLMNRELPERQQGWRPQEWGQMEKHRFHQPPLFAPKQEDGFARDNGRGIPQKECEIPKTGIPVPHRHRPLDNGII